VSEQVSMVEVLRGLGLDVEPLEGESGVWVGEHGTDGSTWTFFAEEPGPEGAARVFSVLPYAVPSDRRAAVAEFAARCNHELFAGVVELDFTDGEVRVRTSARDPNGLSRSLLEALVVDNLGVMGLVFQALVDVGLAGCDPEVAAARCFRAG
jgi:hypothetical protein